MAAGQLSKVIDQLRNVMARQDIAVLADGDLLNRYVRQRDEVAFEALVRRHGPMVMGVCRRVLHNRHDAEDAFQATFLVLVRKASTLRSPGTVGNWLYGVAYRTALEARKAAAKRRAKEAKVVLRPEAPEDAWADLRPVLDQELERLPEKHRAVLVLCDLEGKTRREAARHLGLPEGTVASRLTGARRMLAKRLARHGFGVSGGALAALLPENALACVPPSVVSSTIKAANLYAAGQAAATGVVSVKVAALMEGVLKAMFLTKLKIATAVVFLIAVVGVVAWAGGSTVATATPPGEKPANHETTTVSKKQAKEQQPEKAKKEPDVLTPEEAIKQRAKGKLTVQFKAASVEVKPLRGLKIEGYDEGPFIRLKDGNTFSVLLRGPASYQIMRLGIEPDKHFSGKVVRVTGLVQPDPPDAAGPPFNIWVDDLTHFEVVKE